MGGFMIFNYYSQGDNQIKEERELLNLLEQDWEIISAVSDGHCIVYILKR